MRCERDLEAHIIQGGESSIGTPWETGRWKGKEVKGGILRPYKSKENDYGNDKSENTQQPITHGTKISVIH